LTKLQLSEQDFTDMLFLYTLV